MGLTALQTELASAMVARPFGYLPNLVVLAIGSVLARYPARGVLIGAVNLTCTRRGCSAWT